MGICLLLLYVTEWLHHAKRRLIPAPSQRASGLYAWLSAKLVHASLSQHLRMLVKATRQRREQLMPLCSLPALAAQRFSALPLSGPDLFAGRFQQTVSGEAERRKALREAMFSFGPDDGDAASSSFRGRPSSGGTSVRKKKWVHFLRRSDP